MIETCNTWRSGSPDAKTVRVDGNFREKAIVSVRSTELRICRNKEPVISLSLRIAVVVAHTIAFANRGWHDTSYEIPEKQCHLNVTD